MKYYLLLPKKMLTMILNYITWNVDPVAFSLGPLQVRWYGICWAVGFLLGYLLMSKVYKHEKMPEWSMDSLLLYMLVSTVVGARLGHCLFYVIIDIFDCDLLSPEKLRYLYGCIIHFNDSSDSFIHKKQNHGQKEQYQQADTYG